MDRTPPTANGSSTRGKVTTSTSPSPLQRPAPVSPSTKSPKFPPIKKSKKSSPKKSRRPGVNGKGVSLPKVSSVKFASGCATHELDSGEELEILKCILVREAYLQRLGRASTAGRIGGAHLGETIDVLDLLRLVTLETVEAIVAWRKYKQKNRANAPVELQQFKWNGVNYLLKLASDLEFLSKHTGLVEWLGFTLQRNPFVLPLNLDCRAKVLQSSQATGKNETADSDRFLQVGGKRSQSVLDSRRSSNGGEDAEALARVVAERKRAKTPYETRVVNDEELVPNSPSKTGTVRPKSRTRVKAHNPKYSSVLPSQIGEMDMTRLHEAESVVLQEEAAFGRYARDIHGRVVPEDEAQRRFNMMELSGNVYNVPATLKSSYAAEDAEGNELRLGDPTHSDVPGKLHAKKRSGMLGPISKPEWRSFERPPPPRRRARGAQLEEALAADRKATAQLGVLLDLLREETERKAMDVAYFESCAELQGFGEELRAFTTQAQRELVILWTQLQEKSYMYESKTAIIQKKEELLNTFKVQHKAVKDAAHAKRIESSATKVASLNQEQQRREDQEQAALRAAATAERDNHEQATPFVQHFCATQIQKIVRGMLARELFAQMKIEFVVASTFIQTAIRGFLVRRRVAEMYWHNAASVHIQRVARGFVARNVAREKRRRRLEVQSAERIQKVARGRCGRVRMVKIRELVSWRLQLALAARSINAVALHELANACQAMVVLPNLMRSEVSKVAEEKPLPALVLGIVRLLMIFTSDADDEWEIATTRWREAARFLRCGVAVTRRMQKVADAAAGAARAWMSPSGGFSAAGVAASTPYLRESALGAALLEAYEGDLDFRVETFDRIPRGWQAAVAIFKWTTAFCAIIRLQHLVECSTTDAFLVVTRTLSKRETQQELTERRDADHSEEMLARRFLPAELAQTRGYPFHRPRPLVLVVANDVPRKARAVILQKLQAALPGLFLTISRPPATSKRSLGVQDSTQTFDFKAIRDALALGHSVILEGDVGLRDVTQRAFCSSFATVKCGLYPVPMCVLLRGTTTNRSDVFDPKQGSDMEEEAYREEIVRRMVDADMKLALDRTTRLRLELADDCITREMLEYAKNGDLAPAPSPAFVVVMEAVIVLLTPGKIYEGPSQSDVATSSVSWRLSRRLLAQPAFLRAKLQQVDVTTIPPVNLLALERYLRHSLWPNAVVSRSQIGSSRLVHALAAWIESATRTARMIAGDGTGVLAPEITRFKPVPGLFERVVVYKNCPTDCAQDGAGEDSAVVELMDSVLADVRVYRTAHLLVNSSGNLSTQKRRKKTTDEGERCVVTLFHECRRIFACVYSPSSGQRWMTVISEDDIDNLLTPTGLTVRLPPKTHTEMYARLARLCLLRKRKFEECPESIESPSPFELVLRPRALRLYRHVLQLNGYLTTVTMAELSRGNVQVDAFVHGSNSQTASTQSIALTLAVELENILGRLSASQARRICVPASRVPSLVLDRLHLYCVARTQMGISGLQQKLEPSLRLSVKTSESSPGRVLLRRAVRVPGAESGERLVFTLIERHEDGEFQAAFYAPRSSNYRGIRLPRDVAEELLRLSRRTTPSKLQLVLLRVFCIAKPTTRVHGASVEDSDDDDPESAEEADTMACYRLRRRIIARFPRALRVLEDIHQMVHRKQVIRAYVQVELCDEKSDAEDSTKQSQRSADAIRYRVWLPESCLEQTLLLQESEIEASLPIELSWEQSTSKERREISRDLVRRYFQWDPNGGNGKQGSVVVHLPCGSFWATEVVGVYKTSTEQASSDEHLGIAEQSTEPQIQQKSESAQGSVVSCTCLLDDRDSESDDEDGDDGRRKIYSYETEELVHHGSYRVNGLYLVVRVTMRAEVLRDLQPALASPTDRVRERDSFSIKFYVYHPASSSTTKAEIHGHRDLREVVGPDKPALISSTSLDSLMRHIIVTRLDAQASDRLKVTFLRDRLYAKQKATPVTKTFEQDAGVNAVKLIDEARRRGRAGGRGVKVLTTAKVVPGCGRTLLTVFDVAASHRFDEIQQCAGSFTMLRVDAYICETSARLSLLLEGSDLVHVAGDEDKELLLPVVNKDASAAEIAEMEKERSRTLALVVLDHLRVEQRSDSRGDRLVLSDFSYSPLDNPSREAKSSRLFKTIRAVGHDQVLLSAYLGEGIEASSLSLRLELYDPASSSRCTLKLERSTLLAVLGFPESLELDQVLNETRKQLNRANLTTHISSLLHVEKVPSISEGVLCRPSPFTMSLLFDEQRAMECMRQHISHSGGIDADLEADPQCSWTGIMTSTDGKYMSVRLQLQSTQRLLCSAFAPAELLVSARQFKWTDIPAELLRLLSENTETNDLPRSSVYSLFFSKICEQLRLEVHYVGEGSRESDCDSPESRSLRAKAIRIDFRPAQLIPPEGFLSTSDPMHHSIQQEACSTLSAAIESIAGNGLDGLHAAAIALQRSDGHIQLEFVAEDAINLQPPRPSNAYLHQIQSLESPREDSDTASKKLPADGEIDELLLIPPLMNICILIVGTRGDVQPFLAIALRLQEDGHRVRLATHAVYREFVMSHGIEFYPLGGDPKELAAYMVKTGGNLIPMKIKTLTEDVPRNMQMINEIVFSTWPAVSEADPDGQGPGVPGPPFRAQAIIANPVSYGHVHVAERLGVPLHIMFPQPWVPTMAFPHPLSNLAYTGKWQKKNYLSYKLVDMIMWQGTEGVINEFRTEVLKLHPIRNGDSGSELLLDLSIPHSFMWSPQLVPKPSDWGDLYDVIGTVALKGPASEYSPSPQLEAFLGNDGGPIFVGFGSMVLADPLATTKMIIEAATHAKMRVLIQSSWTDMAGDIDIPSNVFFLGNCPHDWLMPRVSAVVHHGGAGTTAAGLLAGKPTFIVPFFGDQPFWGQAVLSARVGVPPCPIAQLTTEILHNAFVELANPDLRKRAEAMRDLMVREDGAGEAVRRFYHHLPTQDMWCDLDHQRIAMQWSVHDRIKLCDRCAFILRERPENQKKKLVRYHCVDYSARGPSSLLTGVATGAIVFAHELTGGLTGVLLQPARGLINGGVVGAVKGAVTGVYYLLVRPVHGAVLFADRAVAGRKNAKREEGHRKLNNVFDRHLMAALGVQDGLADTFCSATSPNAVDIVIFARRKDRKKMLGRMRPSVRHRYCARYESILLAQRAERLAVCMQQLFSPINGEGSSSHEPHRALPSAVQPCLRCNSSSTMSDSSVVASSSAIKVTGSGTASGSAIRLRLTRLTSAGTVKLTLAIPSESANAVVLSAIASQASHVHASESIQPNAKTKRSKASNPLIPHMNICLAAIGTWDNGVKQFVAIGIKLKEQGHRVRIAANERFRTEIMLRGLEFYPLAGAPESVQDFAKFVYESQNAARAATPGRLGTGAIQAFKELIYSLWPAAFGSDPHGGGANIPGLHFRADSLLWHPLLLGHVHVAERLGIPLQCASLDPLSPTYCFPHPLSSINGIEPTIRTLCQSNLMTYGVVDTTLWHGGVQEVLTQFRAFIGLNKRCDLPDPLVRWEIPHIYLWNPALLPKPLDWGAELSVVGHVTLGSTDGLSRRKRAKREKEGNRFKWPSQLAEVVFKTPSPPVIYFGVSTRAMERDDLDKLLQNIDAAVSALEQKVRIIFQTREIGDKTRAPYQSANVLQIRSDLEYARLFKGKNVAAAIHWGEPDVTAEALSAGKPVGICGTHTLHHFMACVCEQAQVGLPLIDWKTCTVKSLASNFRDLLKPELRERAERLSATFDREEPVNAAVKTFYANLPLEAMRCDVDPSKLARVFDPPHKLKLSLPVYVAIRDKTKVFVPYKPLQFGGNLPPTSSILGNPVKVSQQAKPSCQFDAVRQTLDLLEDNSHLPGSRTLSCSSIVSNPGSLVATPEQIELFWSSTQEESAVRKATTVAYERLVKKPQLTTKREAVMRFFRFRKSTQRREAEQLTLVE